MRHRLFLLPLDFGPGQSLAVVLRVRSSGAINVPLSLHSGAAAIALAQDQGLGQGMFLGALAMLALFNAALYLRLGIRQSLYNTAYILCAGLFLTSMSGLSFQYLWPDWPWLANRSVPLTEILAILSLLWFTRHFLGIGSDRWPRQARLIRALAGIGAALFAASLAVPYALIIKIDTVYALTCMVAMFGLGLSHLRRGERAARWYVLSWLVFFAGYLAYGLAAFGFIPGFMAQERWMQIALGSQMFLLTYAEVMQLHDLMRRALEIEADARSSQHHDPAGPRTGAAERPDPDHELAERGGLLQRVARQPGQPDHHPARGDEHGPVLDFGRLDHPADPDLPRRHRPAVAGGGERPPGGRELPAR